MLASKSILPIFLFLSFLFYSMSMGCGNIFEDMADDSTKEAQLEEAQMVLDKGDYTTAVNMLLSLCGLSAADPTSGTPTCDNATISLLASAYMGRAGLDLIKIIDTAAQDTTIGQQGIFTEFSSLLINGNEQDMENAVKLLKNIQGKTPEQNLQMAVAATADTVLIVRDAVGGFNSSGLPNSVPSSFNTTTTNTVTDNISLISTGISGSGIANADLTSDISTLQTNIAGGDTSANSCDLRKYLCSVNPTATGCPVPITDCP